jgi:hypothetical protein
LEFAIAEQHMNVVCYLLAQDVSISDCSFNTALNTNNAKLIDLVLFVIQEKYGTTYIDFLLSSKAFTFYQKDEINIMDNNRVVDQIRRTTFTPLCLAIIHRHKQMLLLLIKYGAKIHLNDDEAILLAFQLGYGDMLQTLLEMCAQQHNNKNNRIGCCWCHICTFQHPLHVIITSNLAVYDDHFLFEAMLQAKCIDIHFANEHFLRKAVDCEKPEYARLLVRYGANKSVVRELAKNKTNRWSARQTKMDFAYQDMCDVSQCVCVLQTLIDPALTSITLENSFSFVVLRDIVLRALSTHYDQKF